MYVLVSANEQASYQIVDGRIEKKKGHTTGEAAWSLLTAGVSSSLFHFWAKALDHRLEKFSEINMGLNSALPSSWAGIVHLMERDWINATRRNGPPKLFVRISHVEPTYFCAAAKLAIAMPPMKLHREVGIRATSDVPVGTMGIRSSLEIPLVVDNFEVFPYVTENCTESYGGNTSTVKMVMMVFLKRVTMMESGGKNKVN
ncbi:hypothetical protein EVAR_52001_1 [Eumeta japonica]|uniref:Uncharacterized protein n=1 Tax=Eumeta variegata TaxID=151549 RepID=A0A4C1XZL6_EUMVA|nr:hypothetical protein EVAR_52001_1 [Eumeta japonica]